MPAFAFAYGSFGDILATAQLVAKTAILLRNGRRSTECAETEKELKSLGADLASLTVMTVDEALQTSPMAVSVAARIKEEVQRCHSTILRFFEKINASNGLIHKLLWAASEEKELAAFRMRVIERRTALGVVVGMLNSGILLSVQHRVDQVTHGNVQTQEVVKEGVSSLAQQLANYQQQIVAVIRHVPHGVLQETFLVISTDGVSIPVPVVHCSTSQDLYRIVKTHMASRHKAPGMHYWILRRPSCFLFKDINTSPTIPVLLGKLAIVEAALDICLALWAGCFWLTVRHCTQDPSRIFHDKLCRPSFPDRLASFINDTLSFTFTQKP
ncbi:hypothetical protein DFH06DRAFT_1160544 [Mycena polygramma]|nr:hypothetical protein DFH06DRAFT_1160544 [Mycena polygramma]